MWVELLLVAWDYKEKISCILLLVQENNCNSLWWFTHVHILDPFSRDTSGKGCLTSPSCGAKYPGYLMKTHPNHLGPGESVIETLCFSNGKTSCAKTQNIEIMKCKDFFIYKLPAACIKRGRYCGNGSKICDRKTLVNRHSLLNSFGHTAVFEITILDSPNRLWEYYIANNKELTFWSCPI